MPRFAANLTMLFTELPLLDRFEAARNAGFQAVEVLFPYDHDPDEIKRALDDCGLPLTLINTRLGKHRGSAAIPGSEAVFDTDFALALEYAAILKPQHFHMMSGNATGPEAEQTLIANLKKASKLASQQSLLIEPLNQTDMVGYFLLDFATARRVIEAVNAPNLGLQFDAYHAQMMGGDLLQHWAENRDLARHIQIAGVPGRHEPMPSDIDYPAFFEAVAHDGYDGFISAEYNPAGETIAGLNWLNL